MKIYKQNGQAIPDIKVLKDSSDAPSGFSEVTDIVEIANYGSQRISIDTSGWFDKKCIRERLKIAIYTKMQVSDPSHVNDQSKWDLLTDEEKHVAAHWFTVNKDDFLLEVNDSLRYWTIQALEYRNWTMAARTQRMNIMEAIVYLRMNDVGYAKDVLSDLSQIMEDTVIDIDDVTKKLKGKVRIKRMTRMYIDGLESEAHDGVVAIKDYIDETANTPFQNGKGFRGLDSTKFRPNHTPDTVADELLAVIDGTF